MIDRRRLGVYLDEVSDDPAAACSIIQAHNIPFVILRQVWARSVVDLPDDGLSKLKTLLDSSNLRTLMIVSDLGGIPPTELAALGAGLVDRVFIIANYFKAPLVRIHAGFGTGQFDLVVLDKWLTTISARSINANVTPVLEVQPESYPSTATDVAGILSKYSRWALSYDPASIIMNRVLNPYIKYWTLLKGRTKLVELHDFKTGIGPKPVDHGDCELKRTITDATASDYTGYWGLEPGLGRRYSTAIGKPATFELALEAIKPYF